MEGCDRKVPLRSRIKEGEHKGKKVCPSCYRRVKGAIGTTKKAIQKRKEERKDLPVYFQYHVPKAKKCENCGRQILEPGVKNIAHILPKSKFKSINSNLDNAMYLCTVFDGGGCHEEYDSSWSAAKSMVVWELAVSRFQKFERFIKEKSLILNHFRDASK